MRKIMLMGALLLSPTMLAGCGMPEIDDVDLDAIIVKFNEVGLGQYVEEYDFRIGPKNPKGVSYPIDADLTMSPDIEEKNQLEIIKMFRELDSEFSRIDCGEFDCHGGEVTLKMPNEDEVVADFMSLGISMIEVNGELKDMSDLESEFGDKEDTNNSPAISTPSTSEPNLSVDEYAVYTYMKVAYDKLTNYGEDYNPELHDPMVAQLASESFEITPEQAGEIYVKYEMN